jgi:hypothetical protein
MPVETRVLAVSHVNAQGIANALRELEYDVKTAAPDPGRIILRGSPQDVVRAVEFVRQLDSPGTEAAGESEVAYIPLGQYPTNNLMHLVETVAPSAPGTAYALDPTNRMLVVRGDSATIEKVREVVKAVDRPAGAFVLDFFFLRGTVLTEGKNATRNLPADLGPVAEALASSGFQNLTLLAPVTISARQGEPFSSVSGLGPEFQDLMLLVDGTAELTDGGKNVQLRLEAEARRYHNADAAQPRTYAQLFSAKTTVSTAVGKYTVLAAAPAAEGENAAMALAIRVRRAE